MNRRHDCLAAMRANDVDALVLGRDCHVRALTAETRLWLAGTRVFTPAGIVVRATDLVYVPPLTWNPTHLVDLLRAVPGLSSAARVGVDGMAPGAHALLGSVMPDATFVDATPMLRALLRIKSSDEIAALRAAAAVASDALAEMARGLEPGATAAGLRGRFARAAAARGVTTPAFEAIATSAGASAWWSSGGEPLNVNEPVVLRGGVLRDGWEASLARTYRAGAELSPAGWDAAIDRCRPGARAGDVPVLYGVGRGIEALDPEVELEPGMVVAVELEERGALRQDVVHIRADAPELLTAPAPP